MNRLAMGLLIAIFTLTMIYGCFKNPENTKIEITNLTEDEQRDSYANKNELMSFYDSDKLELIKLDKKSIPKEEEKKILQEQILIPDHQVFYLTQFEEKTEENSGVFCLEAFDQNGNRAWSRKWLELEISEMPLGTEAVVDGNHVYVGVSGNLYALELKNGDLLWEANGIGSTTKPVIVDNQVFMSNYDGPILTSLNKENGTVNWMIEDPKELLFPVKNGCVGNVIWIACETLLQGEYRYIKIDKEGTVLDYQKYGMYEDLIPCFLEDVSSFTGGELESFSADNLFDLDTKTAWKPDETNDGIGEWVVFSTEKENRIRKIEIYNGHHGSHKTAKQYGKPSVLKIEFSNRDALIYRIQNPDRIFNVEKIILANLVVAYEMKLTLLDVVNGLDDGVCISEIIVE